MNISDSLNVQGIEPRRLNQIRAKKADDHGNLLRLFDASGEGEPLRCCLRYAEPNERIALISYAPFDYASVWTEVGPVYIHGAPCGGYTAASQSPQQVATGPRVLRTYRADGSMNYEFNTVVTDNADVEPIVKRLLREQNVETVHVRTLAPQCFLFAVKAAP